MYAGEKQAEVKEGLECHEKTRNMHDYDNEGHGKM